MPGPRSSQDWPRASQLLGQKVATLREIRGLSQEDLASVTGISRNQVQNIEHSRNNTRDSRGRPGPGNPRLETVFRLAAALQVDPAYLVDPKRPVHPVPS